MSEGPYGPACEVLDDRHPHGPGWYLIAANNRVEVGPYPTQEAAERAAERLEREARGINPAPWWPLRSPRGLLIGTRVKPKQIGHRRPAGTCSPEGVDTYSE